MRIEDAERILKSKLEEIRIRKKKIEELKRKEKELIKELHELGFPKGSIVLKYVRCGKKGCKRCPHGPYYYLVEYVGRNKRRWVYIGKVVDALEVGKRRRARMIIDELKRIRRTIRMLENIRI